MRRISVVASRVGVDGWHSICPRQGTEWPLNCHFSISSATLTVWLSWKKDDVFVFQAGVDKWRLSMWTKWRFSLPISICAGFHKRPFHLIIYRCSSTDSDASYFAIYFVCPEEYRHFFLCQKKTLWSCTHAINTWVSIHYLYQKLCVLGGQQFKPVAKLYNWFVFLTP